MGVLGLLCAPFEGKKLAVRCDAHLPLLWSLRAGRALAVAVDAVAGLLNISVDVEGKLLLLKEGTCADALRLLNSADANMRLHVLQLMASLAEEPQGRKELQPAGPRLMQISVDEGEEPAMRRHADYALRSLGWIAAGVTV